MSHTTSPSTSKCYGLQRVCKVWEVARSSFYSGQTKEGAIAKPGPKPSISDADLIELIKMDIAESPFTGEGHRKIHARLKRKNIRVGRNRILKRMHDHHLLSPHRGIQHQKNPHDGVIATNEPNIMWCSDGTKIQTVKDGYVWLFSVEEHWNAECLGWHVCKVGDRFAALEPISQAVKQIFGGCSKDIAKGLSLRVDNGVQYTSDYFRKQIAYMGIQESFGLVRQPQTNGIAERFNRTLKEQAINGKIFHDIEEVRKAVADFVEQYNDKWLLQKLEYQSPLEAREKYYKDKTAA